MSDKDDKYFPWRRICIYLCFLSFIFGFSLYHFRIFPFRYIRMSLAGTEALIQKTLIEPNYGLFHPELWRKARTPELGVTRYDASKTYEGLTLFTTSHAQVATLVDMNGTVLHQWSLPFRQAWEEAPHVDSPVAAEYIHWPLVYPFPNGDLLAVYAGQGDTPWGYGVVKMDRNSKVIWRYTERVYHDLDVGEDGRIYAMAHEIRSTPIEGLAGLRPPFLEEFVVILSPEGKELDRISMYEAIRDSRYRTFLSVVGRLQAAGTKGDYIHSNSVHVIRRRQKVGDTVFEPGQVIVSMRNLNAIAVIDPGTKIFTWAATGSWRAQHDAELLDNGNMILFDNKGHVGPGGRSRVMEVVPATQEIVWQYTGSEEEYFYSYNRSRQQRLANGNTLIIDANGGRLFEVTPSNEIVWEYYSPFRGGDKGELIPLMLEAVRVPTDFFTAPFN